MVRGESVALITAEWIGAIGSTTHICSAIRVFAWLSSEIVGIYAESVWIVARDGGYSEGRKDQKCKKEDKTIKPAKLPHNS